MLNKMTILAVAGLISFSAFADDPPNITDTNQNTDIANTNQGTSLASALNAPSFNTYIGQAARQSMATIDGQADCSEIMVNFSAHESRLPHGFGNTQTYGVNVAMPISSIFGESKCDKLQKRLVNQTRERRDARVREECINMYKKNFVFKEDTQFSLVNIDGIIINMAKRCEGISRSEVGKKIDDLNALMFDNKAHDACELEADRGVKPSKLCIELHDKEKDDGHASADHHRVSLVLNKDQQIQQVKLTELELRERSLALQEREMALRERQMKLSEFQAGMNRKTN